MLVHRCVVAPRGLSTKGGIQGGMEPSIFAVKVFREEGIVSYSPNLDGSQFYCGFYVKVMTKFKAKCFSLMPTEHRSVRIFR